MSYLDAGQSDEAVNAFLKALSLDPNDYLALNNIGAIYNNRGEAVKARPFLLRVVEFFPDYYDGVMNLGINYYLTGELRNAELTFKKAVALNPRSTEVLSRLGDVYLGMGEIGEAGEYYRAAVELGGSTAYLEYNMARVEALGDRPEEAVKRLESSLRMGYGDFQMITRDPALDSLRGRQDFKDLIKKYFGR
jgi:Flp pilus assembly protein TadD